MDQSKQRPSQEQPTGGSQPNAPNDPNREPGDEHLYNRDKQGNIFYDKNTEIRRESQFHDATAAPVDDEGKVTEKDDQFRNETKR